MQETQAEEKRKGLASLFDDYEIKDLFRRFIQLLVVIEVLIFLVCWVYQLGLDQVAATGQVVDIPFPWKAYFLVSFIAPVAVTFLAGIAVVGFNSFIYGRRGEPIFKEEQKDGTSARLAKIANFCLQLPFLFLLLLLGVLVGAVYNMGEIIQFLGRFGESATRFILIGLAGLLVAGTIFGVVRMVLNYKLRKKNMEYAYKREVMDRLGIAIVDEQTVLDREGRLVDLKARPIDISPEDVKPLPPAPPEKGQPDRPEA
jgi:hypothetical protein